ncbi:TIR domain-containing protein [Tsukamurella pseudospumae]|uniref:Molecular chaperone Tir n=1 Tax=Tsukamurella pseudospumae TaxID=239498 RepID=A0A138AU07_9ACTN|nr:TIR domain-containing protein [Tsukamurella pseudospumae]KXP13912.1 molecular chaperone Tir [Tsukamurella pseudospumae]
MAKSVFYSFHYDRDNWRVNMIRNMGKLDGTPVLNAQDWESIRRTSDAAIKTWIEQQMKYKSAVVVLVGAQTSTRPWVKHEIVHAWNNRRPLVGIRIHKLLDQNRRSDYAGNNPFDIALKDGTNMSNYVRLHDPAGADSQQAYNSILTNIVSWVDGAYTRA